MRYRQKLARARQLLARRRGTELIQTVDELLAPPVAGMLIPSQSSRRKRPNGPEPTS